MKVEVRVPSLSESQSSANLLSWRKAVGDAVMRDETLVDLETDKVILEIPAAASGTLVEIRQPEGAEVKPDQVVAVIETASGAEAPLVETGDVQTPGGKGRVPTAGPALETKVDRVDAPAQATVETVTRPVSPAPVPREGTPGARNAPSPQAGAQRPAKNGGVRREKMSRLRSRIAERLVAAQHTAAMLTTFNEVNVQAVNALRQRYKAEFEIRHGVKLGYMSFFVRAVCVAMRQFPVLNAAIDGDEIVWHDDIDIGVAVSSPRGLVVPVLRRAQTLSAAAVEAAIADFAVRAKEARLTLDDLAGGTFSITNGGVFGSLLSTPILNPPQSAILGMHAIQQRPVAENGQVVIRPMMYLALTYDHRLVDGRDAVQFLVAVKAALETPEALLENPPPPE